MYESMVLNYPGSLFGQFERLRRELDDVFGAPSLPSSIRAVAQGSVPAVNMGRTPTSFEINAFAPGLAADKIEVTVDRGVLRIAGERASDIPAGGPKLSGERLEIRVEGDALLIEGSVQPATPEGLEAVYAELRIPKQAHAQPRSIEVSAG